MSRTVFKSLAILCLSTSPFLAYSEESTSKPESLEPTVSQTSESDQITSTNNDTQTTSQETSTVTTTGLVPLTVAQDDKHWAIGLSTYSLGLYTEDNSYFADDYDYDDEYFVGGAIFVNYHFSDSVSARIQFYGLEHEDFSEIEVSGTDVLLHWGGGFLNEGFKWYIGGGAYSETLEVGEFEEDFSGAQFHGGLGYNWQHIGLDFSLGFRTTSDYEDFIEEGDESLIDRDEDMFAMTVALGVYVRF
ncbi:hypothetical protein [Thalassomonas sp. M1454]|uniref:hypothetical protein n=1 Tax=Thalassomonas sp. M1454 TaxID=2594477 RepID=UPI00117ED9F9|nr:hypothetical protein [Thalassomonas sp. M1454]TRX57157.1 hypothetical protein FNN08_06570 [Thalassomonas sp. M1454]